VTAHEAGLDTSEVNEVVEIGGWAGATKFPARHLQSEDIDLTIRSEGGSEQVVAEISFMSSPERIAIMLHEELAIAPT
jgi:hypothetical protein